MTMLPNCGKTFEFPFTIPQRDIWYDQLIHGDSPLYNIGGYMKLAGPLDLPLFHRSMELLVQKHDALRLRPVPSGSAPMQRLVDAHPVDIPVHDLCSQARPQEAALDLMNAEMARPFDLGGAEPLFRCAVLKLDTDSFWCFVCYHHLIADGWTIALLARSQAAIYTALLNGRDPELAAPSYRAFVDDDAAYQASASFEAQRRYWSQKLQPALEPMLLASRKEPVDASPNGGAGRCSTLALPRGWYDRLDGFAKTSGATAFHAIIAALYVYFTRTAGREELVLGLPVLNRSHAGFKATAGPFVGVTAARFRFGHATGFAELMGSIARELRQDYRHQRFPVSALRREPGLVGQRLFDIVVSFERHDHDAAFGLARGPAAPLVNRHLDNPLTLFVREFHAHEAVQLDFAHHTGYLTAEEVAALQRRLVNLLDAALQAPDRPVASLPLLTPAEHEAVVGEEVACVAEPQARIPSGSAALLQGFNRTRHDFPLDKTYAALFAEQAAATPDRVAAVCMAERLTYRELDERSTRIARALVEEGAAPEVPVGVLAERGLCYLAMLIAVFKAGAAYVPLDPRHPPRRLADIVQAAGLPLVLVSQHMAGLLGKVVQAVPAPPRAMVAEHLWSQGDAEPLPPIGTCSDLAYVIFTSGSTGKPKGAMVEQRGMLNNLFGKVPAAGLHAADRVAQTASPAFDISVWQFLAAPILGGAVHILPDEVAHDPGRLMEEIAAQEITVAQFVPSMLRLALQTEPAPPGSSLRVALAAGEALAPDLAVAWFGRFPSVPLVNIYGPAECADNVAFHVLRDASEVGSFAGLSSVSIGRPTANNMLFILDAHLQPVPPGASGEICVSGVGVGRGYLNDPAATALAFVDHPLQTGARLYRTGDRGRHRLDGKGIDYLGRRDHQVKVRGQRVEIGEIEARIRACEGVRDAAVVARNDPGMATRLVGYWVGDAARRTDEDALLRSLGDALPGYMVPAFFVELESLPLNVSGKVDRAALAGLPWKREERAVEAPATAVEKGLHTIWATLLGGATIGRDDNFFHLGGDSLLATRLVSLVRTGFGVVLPLKDVFEAPTLRRMASRVEDVQAEGLDEFLPQAADRGQPLPLSFAQHRMLLVDRLAPGQATYHMAGGLRVRGKLDVAAVEAAIGAVAQRHEVLRTHYPFLGGEAAQRVSPSVVVPLTSADLTAWPEGDRGTQALAACGEAASRPFDLGREPPLRLHVLKLREGEHWLLITLHHIAGDGWSVDILQREFSALYRALVTGTDPALPALPLQYADFSAWQRGLVNGERWRRDVDYWRAQLDGAPESVELPLDRPRTALRSHRGARLRFTLPPVLSGQLKALSLARGATLYMTLLGAFGVLLSRHGGQRELCIGTPVANRGHAAFNGLIGCFVNTLVMRLNIDGLLSFEELLGRVRDTALAAYEHQDLPFEHLIEAARPSHSLVRSPLFQVMFVLQDGTWATTPELHGLQTEPLDIDLPVAKFDLTLEMRETAQGLAGSFEYSTELFDHPTIESLAARWRLLLDGLAAQPDAPVGMLPLLPPTERSSLLREFNRSRHDFPLDTTYAVLFSEQAASTPDRVAAVCMGERLTYRELDERSNRIARALVGAGAAPEIPVGVLAERGLCFLAMLIGVFKAGAAYVPLDPRHPPQRLAEIAQAAGLPLVLVSQNMAGLLDRVVQAVPLLPTPPRGLVAEHLWLCGDAQPLPACGACGDLAYVIFTSGSTGKPKGAMVEQRGMLNNLFGKVPAAGLQAGDRVAQTASPAFDISVWQFLAAPILGGTVHILPDEVAHDPGRLMEEIAAQRITVAQFVPSVLRLALQAPAVPQESSLRCVLVAGEALPPDLAAAWFGRFPSVPLVNIYGPAECADNVAFHVLQDASEVEGFGGLSSVPIGRPTANNALFILDDQLQPVPPGAPGEICVGGIGVGRGYLNDPAATALAFLDDPFHAGARLYRTGDRGRHRRDGKGIDYLGRRDHQVKVRGQRAETGEIEARLRACKGVGDAAVVPRKDLGTEPVLVAYWVRDAGRAIGEHALRQSLGETLPGYMVPAFFVELASLPLNLNGKVDRTALAGLPWTQEDRAVEAPTTTTEKRLHAIWAELLGGSTIGREDNFFHLGGNSLTAMQVVSRARRTFKVSLPLKDVFEAPTLSQLALRVDGAQAEGLDDPPLARVGRDKPLPLSHAQQQLWFLDQLEPGCAWYNIPGGLRLVGELDANAMSRALNDLVMRHEVLRMSVRSEGGEASQRIDAAANVQLACHDLSALEPPQRRAQAQRLAASEAAQPFELECAPMLRAQLLRLSPLEHWLLLTLHHIAADGWSIDVLLRDLAAFYQARRRNQAAPLAALPVQYADFAAWQRASLHGDRRDGGLAYWRRQLDGAPDMLELPTDHLRPATPSRRGGHVAVDLGGGLAGGLRRLSQDHQVTLFTTLASAFALLLGRCSNQEEVCIGTPVANRQRAELEGLIGFFVNTVVLRLRLRGHLGFTELLRQTQQTVLAAQAYQDVPFDRLVEALRPDRRRDRTPFFQAMFTLDDDRSTVPVFDGLDAQALELPSPPIAKFDLTLRVVPRPGSLFANFEYATDLFDRATIERLAGHFRTLLLGIVEQPGRALADLPLLSERERWQLLVDWNQTRVDLPAQATLHGQFESRVRLHPDAVAVEFGQDTLTYSELNQRANRLAHHLRSQGAQADQLIGVCIERSPDMVVAVLGALKSGGAYLPVDPGLPSERMAFMFGDAGLKLLVTQERHLDRLPAAGGVKRVCLDRDADKLSMQPIHDPEPLMAGDQGQSLAYVMYTSGSTGHPKAVGVTHQAVHRLVSNTNYIELTRSTRMAQTANFAFDAATFEIWGALIPGGCLCLFEPDLVLTPAAFANALVNRRITTLFLTTALFNQVAHQAPGAFRTVAHVLFGGEACNPAAVQEVLKAGAPEHLLHVYGPTENTTFSSWSRIESVRKGATTLPIGRPVSNSTAYVLDSRLNPVPIGVAGELYVGGTGLARGYVGRPDTTAEHFLQDPFSGQPGARMYKTGDMVRHRPNGQIEYIGRTDDQVKIRGHRIEPGEVDHALAQVPGVARTVVLAKPAPEGGQQLVAYVEPQPGAPVTAASLRAALQRRLPGYMVPSHFLVLGQLPVNANGKLDRQSLKALSHVDGIEEHEPPITLTERRLAEIWSETLGRERVGRDEDFFDAGGHSLLAVRLMASVNDAFKASLSISQLFLSPSIAALGAVIDNHRQTTQLVVRLKQGMPGGAPIWLIHPGGGTVFCYRALAERLPAEGAVYAIQSPEVARSEETPPDFDALCKRYVAEVLCIQPTGPIQLSGWSMGGAIAFRMTELLEQAGHEVGWVALFDTLLPSGREPQGFAEFVAWACEHFDADAWAQIAGKANVREPIDRHRIARLVQRMTGGSGEALGGSGLDQATVDFLRRQHDIQQSHLELMRGFEPGMVAAPVHAFHAEASSGEAGIQQVDWLRHTTARGGSTQRTLPGRHENVILLPSNIEAIVNVLRRSPTVGIASSLASMTD